MNNESVKRKGLVLAHFPSPYRVDVFKELSKEFDLTIYFEICKDQNRSSEWFVKNTGLNSKLIEEGNNYKLFKNDIRNIKKYDFVLAYDYHTIKSMKMQISAIRNNIPYFINCDGAFIRTGIVKKIVKRYFFKRASLFFASGNNAKKYFIYFGADEKKIFIHNFTSLHKNDILNETINKDEKVTLRKKLGIKNKKTVLSIGQFIERKGFDVLLEAWKELDKKYQLIIIGGGDLEDSYKKIISQNKLLNVKLINFIPKKEIFNYYKASDLFVLPTREDIWGLVINEAMACGLPIITTNKCIAGLELVNDNENGYIVDVGDSKELGNKIDKVLKNDDLAKVMSNNNIKLMQNNTIENIAKSHIENINNFFDLR